MPKDKEKGNIDKSALIEANEKENAELRAAKQAEMLVE